MGSAAEKREHSRYSFRYTDKRQGRFALFLSGKRKTTSNTEVLDISEGGLGFIVDQELAPRKGQKVAVEFTIPGQDQVAIFGTVTHIEKVEIPNSIVNRVKVGVKFQSLPPKYKKFISIAKEDIDKESYLEIIHGFGKEWKSITNEIREEIAMRKRLFIWGGVTALIIASYFFIKLMDEYAQTQWWIQQAERFYDEMKSNYNPF